MRTLKDFTFQGKRVLLRCDLNVPIEHGEIQDDFRIAESIPTIQYITGQGGICIILAHFGRPDPLFENGKGADGSVDSLRLIAQHLEKLVGKPVRFFEKSVLDGSMISDALNQMARGEIALLENIRFYEGEKENDKGFAKKLADLGDIYVNDAFGACHRAHASIMGIPNHIPSAMGLLLEKETHALGKVSKNPDKPLVVAVGGAKVETKASFLKEISKNADAILLGNLITEEVKKKGIDVAPGTKVVYAIDGVDGAYDLGSKTVDLFIKKIQNAKTVFWAGPLGMIEDDAYEKGSLAIAEAIIASAAYTVAGGGDLAAFLGKHELREKFDHVSTGGGAMLAFLSGEELPGLKALE